MRILLVESNEDGTVGGSHRALFDLVRNLDRSMFSPVVAFYQPNSYASVLRATGVEVVILEQWRRGELRNVRRKPRVARWPGYAGAIFRRWRLLVQQEIDLLHLMNSPFLGSDDWLLAAIAARVPAVAFAMGLAPAYVSLPHRVLVRLYDQVLPVSLHTAGEMRRCGVPSEKMVVTYLGVDADEIASRVSESREVVRARLGVGEHDVLGLMVGNLRYWKGQHVVIDALLRLKRQARDSFVMLFAGAASAGDEEYAGEIQARATRSGAQVRFLGPRTDVPNLLNAADIAIHASVQAEPFGLVVTEAMALGKAVVASSIGGPAEILSEGSGILFDPSRPDRLADILGNLILRPDQRLRLGIAARRRVRDFSIDRLVHAVEAIYLRLMCRRRSLLGGVRGKVDAQE